MLIRRLIYGQQILLCKDIMENFVFNLYLFILEGTLFQTQATVDLYSNIYIYLLCLTMGVCLFVCLYPTFCMRNYMTPRKVYRCSEFQKVVSNHFCFRKILKINEKNCKSAKKSIIVLLKKKCRKIKKRLKFKIEVA